MKKRIGLGLVLLISIVFGVTVGQVFQALFLNTVPQAVLTPVLRATVVGACWAYGVGIGVVAFIWVLAGGLILAGFSRKGRSGGDAARGPDAGNTRT